MTKDPQDPASNVYVPVARDAETLNLDEATSQSSVMLLETCQMLHQENTSLRHALDDERFEQHKLRSAVSHLRSQIADQGRALETSSWTIAELRRGEEERAGLVSQIAALNHELEKSSCTIADLCGRHEQNIILASQLANAHRELQQASSTIADLNGRVDASDRFQEEADRQAEEASHLRQHNAALVDRLAKADDELRHASSILADTNQRAQQQAHGLQEQRDRFLDESKHLQHDKDRLLIESRCLQQEKEHLLNETRRLHDETKLLRDQADNLRQQAADVSNRLSESNSSLADLRHEQVESSHVSERLFHRAHELEQQLSRTMADLNAMRASTSWRLTKPLRATARLLKSLRSRSK